MTCDWLCNLTKCANGNWLCCWWGFVAVCLFWKNIYKKQKDWLLISFISTHQLALMKESCNRRQSQMEGRQWPSVGSTLGRLPVRRPSVEPALDDGWCHQRDTVIGFVKPKQENPGQSWTRWANLADGTCQLNVWEMRFDWWFYKLRIMPSQSLLFFSIKLPARANHTSWLRSERRQYFGVVSV